MDIMGPLGNGFALLEPDARAIVVGGGIGTPPMLETAKHYAENCTAILGFRDAAHVILDEDFDACGCDVRLATDDGSRGHHGFVTDLLRQRLTEESADIIYACGPKGMLKAVADLAAEFGVRCQVSLEERMAAAWAPAWYVPAKSPGKTATPPTSMSARTALYLKRKR